MVSLFSASAAGGALDGGRIPKIYDKNMKKLRKDFKHFKDNLLRKNKNGGRNAPAVLI